MTASGGYGYTGRLARPGSDVAEGEVVKGEFGSGDRFADGPVYGAVQRAVLDSQGAQLRVKRPFVVLGPLELE